jgi:hypothetical protein
MDEHYSRPLPLVPTFESGWGKHVPMSVLPFSRAFEPKVLPWREGFSLESWSREGSKAGKCCRVHLHLIAR